MLKDIHNLIKCSYDSTSDNIAKEFYNVILRETMYYKRVSGYFSAKVLSLYSEGLEYLDNNNGIVKFIISHDLSIDDFSAIKEGYKKRELNENLTDKDKLRLGNLAFLIAQGKADVKFGFVPNGLFHSKWALFEDGENTVYFNGSMNETVNGLENNYESFDVDYSWDTSSNVRSRIIKRQEEFDLLWNNKYPGIQVMEANSVVYELIENYNCGRIRKEIEIVEDSFCLTMNQEQIMLVDNTQKNILYKKSVKSKFAIYIEESLGYPYIRDNVSYLELENIINISNKQADKWNINFFVADEIIKLIDDKKYSIEQYRKSGLMIKEKNSIWKKEFDQFKEIVNKEISRELKIQQMEAAFYLMIQKRAANFSVPGAGKTAMLLAVFAYLSSEIHKSPIKRILVICPLNAFKSWKDEFELVFGNKRKLKLLTNHDEAVQGNALNFENLFFSANLVLVNYESVIKYKDSIIKLLQFDSDTILIFDEVHRIKGITAKRSKAALELSNNSEYRYVLTGTPIPNNYVDIYNFLHILYNDEYASHFGFETSVLKNPSQDNIIEINEKLYPYFWRTSKEDLAVPKADPDIIKIVNPSNEQRRIAEIIYTELSNPLAIMIRMLQLSTNPELIYQKIEYSDLGLSEYDDDNQSDSLIDREIKNSMSQANIARISDLDINKVKSPKFEEGIQLIKEILKTSKKIVVWGLFTNTLEKIKSRLNKEGINTELIYGNTAKTDRELIIDKFREQNSNIQVLVSNPNTLGESVSLHNVAHDAVYFEFNYNLTFMLQSRDRIHRLGLQENQKTRYYYLMTSANKKYYNFIDEKVYNRLKEKEEIMHAAIDGEYLAPEFPDNELNFMKTIILDERKI